jgi:hypothetical protein
MYIQYQYLIVENMSIFGISHGLSILKKRDK